MTTITDSFKDYMHQYDTSWLDFWRNDFVNLDETGLSFRGANPNAPFVKALSKLPILSFQQAIDPKHLAPEALVAYLYNKYADCFIALDNGFLYKEPFWKKVYLQVSGNIFDGKINWPELEQAFNSEDKNKIINSFSESFMKLFNQHNFDTKDLLAFGQADFFDNNGGSNLVELVTRFRERVNQLARERIPEFRNNNVGRRPFAKDDFKFV